MEKAPSSEGGLLLSTSGNAHLFRCCSTLTQYVHFGTMHYLTIALAQINPTVGDLAGNAQKILAFAERARTWGASLVLFPELVLSGYPPEDLVLKRHFLEDCESQLREISNKLPSSLVAIVGYPCPSNGEKAYNAAAILRDGKVLGVYHKMLLPNYGVFDEERVFQAGSQPMLLELEKASLALHICEDSWSLGATPSRCLRDAHVDAVLNISSSPYHRAKRKERESVMRDLARSLNTYVYYCNLVGGQDELVFDGSSLVVSDRGKLLARLASFKEDLVLYPLPLKRNPSRKSQRCAKRSTHTLLSLTVDHPSPATQAPSAALHQPLEELEEIYLALRLGLRDYVRKNGFQQTILGISGGIDSALVATLAVDALGSNCVNGISMPSQFSSTQTRNDAKRLMENLDIAVYEVPIEPLFATYLKALMPLWSDRPPDSTEENLQARIRGTIVMALSNKFGWLVLATGNKSELATGYCTLYGDMAGGFAVIKDIPKTLVYELARWRNAQERVPKIPISILKRAPSAELRPNQKDTDSLPAYEVLDPLIERFVEQDQSSTELIAAGFEKGEVERVIRWVEGNEYKRRQGPPGIKITPKSFGRDRRLPITNAYHERL